MAKQANNPNRQNTYFSKFLKKEDNFSTDIDTEETTSETINFLGSRIKQKNHPPP